MILMMNVDDGLGPNVNTHTFWIFYDDGECRSWAGSECKHPCLLSVALDCGGCRGWAGSKCIHPSVLHLLLVMVMSQDHTSSFSTSSSWLRLFCIFVFPMDKNTRRRELRAERT